MVNIEQLQSDLSQHGNINFCDIHNPTSFVVAMDGVSDISSVQTIVNNALSNDYPNEVNSSFVSGVYKCERVK